MIAYELGLRLPVAADNRYLLHKWLWDVLAPQRHIELHSSLLFRTVFVDEKPWALARFDSAARQRIATDLPFESVPCPIMEFAQVLHFSVRLCPLYRVGGNLERTPADHATWAEALLLRHGLRVESMTYGANEVGSYAKTGQRAIRHNTRVYQIAASVADVAIAQHAWMYGIGRRKSTGCGLLLEQ